MYDNRKIYSTRRRSQRPRPFRLLILLLCCFGAVAFYWVAASATKSQTVPVAAESSSKPTVSTSSASPSSANSPSSKAENPSKPVPQVSLQKADKPLWVTVKISNQLVTVYDASNRLVRNCICSTGKEGSDTPIGTYTVKERGTSFFSRQYQEGGYYWTQFQGDFLFHSVPFDKNRKIEPEEAQKLGTKASHGCVRLAIEDAKWIYDNIPRGTKVVIEK